MEMRINRPIKNTTPTKKKSNLCWSVLAELGLDLTFFSFHASYVRWAVCFFSNLSSSASSSCCFNSRFSRFASFSFSSFLTFLREKRRKWPFGNSYFQLILKIRISNFFLEPYPGRNHEISPDKTMKQALKYKEIFVYQWFK